MIITAHLLGNLGRGLHDWYVKRQKRSRLNDSLWDDFLWCKGGTWISDGNLLFEPPVYLQRYSAVAEIIEQLPHRKKVVDFGCAELKLFTYLKKVPGVNHIVHVDVDRELLERSNDKVRPLASDYLLKARLEPLKVEVYCGSAAEYHSCLDDVDIVVAVELIEHLQEPTLHEVVANVFGRVRPRWVILTTPNVEFNVMFTGLVGMRHWDHKFEWTRLQFQQWCEKILGAYPIYRVRLYGVGPGPEGSQHLGCVSQLALFTRIQQPCLREDTPSQGEYSLICAQEFPHFVETRSLAERLHDEVSYRLETVRRWHNQDLTMLPLMDFLPFLQDISQDITQISELLTEQGWTVSDCNGSLQLHIPDDDSVSTRSEDDYDCELDDHSPRLDDKNDEEEEEEETWGSHDSWSPNQTVESCNLKSPSNSLLSNHCVNGFLHSRSSNNNLDISGQDWDSEIFSDADETEVGGEPQNISHY